MSLLDSNAVDRRLKPRSGQTKDYEIGSWCLLVKHAALRSKSKDWLARNQDKCDRVGRHVYQWIVVSAN